MKSPSLSHNILRGRLGLVAFVGTLFILIDFFAINVTRQRLLQHPPVRSDIISSRHAAGRIPVSFVITGEITAPGLDRLEQYLGRFPDIPAVALTDAHPNRLGTIRKLWAYSINSTTRRNLMEKQINDINDLYALAAIDLQSCSVWEIDLQTELIKDQDYLVHQIDAALSKTGKGDLPVYAGVRPRGNTLASRVSVVNACTIFSPST